MPGWNDALPSVANLARELVGSGELIDLAVAEVPVGAVADALWDRLGSCRLDVQRIASMQLDVERIEPA